MIINCKLTCCNIENNSELINLQTNQELIDTLNDINTINNIENSNIDENNNEELENDFEIKELSQDSIEIENNLNNSTIKSPTTAIYYSIIPGLGQYYVESYTKSVLFFTSAATLSGLIIYYNNNFIKDRDKLYQITDPKLNSNNQNSDGVRNNERHIGIGNYTVNSNEYTFLRNSRENNRDNRDRMGFFLGVLYIISTIDAYTDAHLFNFNVNDKLSYSIMPNINNFVNINICYKF